MIVGRKPIGTVSYMGGVPAVMEEFCWSWSQLIQYNAESLEDKQNYIHYIKTTYSDHGPARNDLLRRIFGQWILMLDTDHTFEPDILARILALHEDSGAKIISGLYRFKKEPFTPVAFAGKNHDPIAEWSPEANLLEITGAGAGCLWIHLDAIRELRGKCSDELFTRMHGLSEDHSFFRRCEEHEIKTYLAPNVECDHLRVVPVTSVDEIAPARQIETLTVGGFE